MSKYESRLIRPWEEERDRLPNVVKMILAIIGIAVLFGILMNQCSIQEAYADGGSSIPYWNSDAQRREVQALESIAESLKKIERKMK